MRSYRVAAIKRASSKVYGNMSVMVVAVDLGRVDAHHAAPYRAVYHVLTARAPVVRGDLMSTWTHGP